MRSIPSTNQGDGAKTAKRDPSRGTPPGRTSLAWFVGFALLYAWVMGGFAGPRGVEISYSELEAQLAEDNVARIHVRGAEIEGELRTPYREEEGERAHETFRTTAPPFAEDRLGELLAESDVEISAEPDTVPLWQSLLVGLLPVLLLVALLVWSGRTLQRRALGDRGGPFGLGRSKAKRYQRDESRTTFADVAGLESAKQDLRQVVDFLSHPEHYASLGAKLPKGVLLMGPPGTGKTLLARAVAGEAGVPFFSIGGSEFIETFVGVGAARVRSMFDEAKQDAPAVLFIDEIDSVGRSRGSGLGGGHDEREQTLNQILSEMDGFAPHQAVVVLAATNRPDVLDPALLRPGRFDRKLTLELPRRPARRRILEVHTRRVPLADDVDLDDLARGTVGFSGADLENLVNEAALLAGRELRGKVTAMDFEEARNVIVLGREREDLVTEHERRRVAYHESGHALAAAVLPHTDALRQVTIVPRGRALGATEQTPDENRYTRSRSELFDRLAVMLGGRAAEQVTFDEVSSGAADDLARATDLARKMVTEFGMSERLGGVSFRYGEEHVFLGKELSEARKFSERTAELIDEEIRKLIRAAETRVLDVLRARVRELDALAAALLERETVDAAEVQALLRTTPRARTAG